MAVPFTITTMDEAVTRPSNTLFAGHTACSLQSDKGYRLILAKRAFSHPAFYYLKILLSRSVRRLSSFTQNQDGAW
jgi:hypothetical protein